MPFTNAWSDNLPPVGALANTIGVEGRKLRLDLEERLENALVVDMSADPLVILDKVAGKRVGAQLIVSACEFLSDLHAKENDIGDGELNVFVGTNMYAPLPHFLTDCTITKIEWLVDINTATSLDLSLMERTFANGAAAASAISTLNKAAAGKNIVDTGVIALGLNTNFQFYLKVLANGGAGTNGVIYAARITYSRPA